MSSSPAPKRAAATRTMPKNPGSPDARRQTRSPRARRSAARSSVSASGPGTSSRFPATSAGSPSIRRPMPSTTSADRRAAAAARPKYSSPRKPTMATGLRSPALIARPPSPAGGAAVPPSSWPGSPGGRAAPGRTGGGAEAVGGGVARLVEVGPAADGAAGQGLAHQHQRGHGGAGGPEVGGQPAHRRPDHGFVGPAGPDDDGRRGVGAVARARRQELGHQLVGPGGG